MNIFISHIHEEEMIAFVMKEQLLLNFGSSVNIFLSEQIQLGGKWFDQIKKSLTNADIVLAIFSPYSIERPWINIEVGYSIMSDKKVIPILCLGLKINRLPAPFSFYQSVDICNIKGAVHLLNVIFTMVETPQFNGNIQDAAFLLSHKLQRICTIRGYPQNAL